MDAGRNRFHYFESGRSSSCGEQIEEHEKRWQKQLVHIRVQVYGFDPIDFYYVPTCSSPQKRFAGGQERRMLFVVERMVEGFFVNLERDKYRKLKIQRYLYSSKCSITSRVVYGAPARSKGMEYCATLLDRHMLLLPCAHMGSYDGEDSDMYICSEVSGYRWNPFYQVR